ncbi:MAG: RNA methyltransferase [Aureispira sp.]|nr:RNA methyltransferase [Aureispira sp.]
MSKHPRDQFITVYGRKPVKEVLENQELDIDKVLLDKRAKGNIIREILTICKQRGVEVTRVDADRVSKISKNPKQDQGIVADVVSPQAADAASFLEGNQASSTTLIALDGVTTPTNVGMVIRSCTALGVDGILLPRKGSAKISPLVIKSSAGVVFKSTLLKCERLTPIIKLAKQKGFKIYGLSGEKGSNIYTSSFHKKSIFVLGNESNGVSSSIADLVDYWLTIPMANNVESLNIACAGTIVGSEIMRRK